MSKLIRAAAAAPLALLLLAGGCGGNPESAASFVPSAQAEPSLKRDYYGVTDMDIPGDDGQVVSYEY